MQAQQCHEASGNVLVICCVVRLPYSVLYVHVAHEFFVSFLSVCNESTVSSTVIVNNAPSTCEIVIWRTLASPCASYAGMLQCCGMVGESREWVDWRNQPRPGSNPYGVRYVFVLNVTPAFCTCDSPMVLTGCVVVTGNARRTNAAGSACVVDRPFELLLTGQQSNALSLPVLLYRCSCTEKCHERPHGEIVFVSSTIIINNCDFFLCTDQVLLC